MDNFLIEKKLACNRAGVQYGDNVKDRRGNLTGIAFHSLRHARITEWVKAGYSDEIFRMASGHESLDAYCGYIHLKSADVMRLVSSGEIKTDKNRTKSVSPPYSKGFQSS